MPLSIAGVAVLIFTWGPAAALTYFAQIINEPWPAWLPWTLFLAGVVIALALRGAVSELRPGDIGSYAAGPAFAIAGLMLAGVFDPVHLNSQTGALLFTLMALCLESRPFGRRWSGVSPTPA